MRRVSTFWCTTISSSCVAEFEFEKQTIVGRIQQTEIADLGLIIYDICEISKQIKIGKHQFLFDIAHSLVAY